MVAVDEPAQSTTNTLSLPVDAEHTGIRLAGCTTLIGSGIVLFFLGSFITNLTGMVVLLLSIVLASAIAYGTEKFLKQRWKSGRMLVADTNTIAIRKGETVERTVDPNQQVNVLTWTFNVKRSSRVKKGWHVIGLSLEQDDNYVPVYTFASPDDFERMPLSEHFTMLEKPPKDDKEKIKAASTMRHAGEQRRLHEAEVDRSMFGAEVTLSQFIEYLEFLQKTYPQWMLS
jgi:hypothetical protein